MQTVDYILAWIAMEDDGVCLTPFGVTIPLSCHCSLQQIRSHLQRMLARRDKSLKDIVQIVRIYRNNVDEGDITAESGEISQKEILQSLIAFLDAC